MKKLKLNLQEFKNTEVLTREQLKNVMGGDGGSGVGPGFCYTQCSGYKWNASQMRYDYVTETCIYFKAGDLPATCSCSALLEQATGCS